MLRAYISPEFPLYVVKDDEEILFCVTKNGQIAVKDWYKIREVSLDWPTDTGDTGMLNKCAAAIMKLLQSAKDNFVQLPWKSVEEALKNETWERSY